MKSVMVDGPAVRRAREMAGLTQEDLAKKVGVDRSTIGHWESDKPRNKPGGPNFKALCEALGVSQESLVVPDDQAA